MSWPQQGRINNPLIGNGNQVMLEYSNVMIHKNNQGRANETPEYQAWDRYSAEQMRHVLQRYPGSEIPEKNADISRQMKVFGIDLKKDNQTIPIHIIITSKFPQKGPTIQLKTKVKSQYVKPSTMEINYITFFSWNDKSSLLSLIEKIDSYFIKNLGQQDLADQELYPYQLQLKNSQQYTRPLSGLMAKSLNEIFPGKTDEEIRNLNSQQDFSEQIMTQSEYTELMNTLLVLSDLQIYISQLNLDKIKELDSSKSELQDISMWCAINQGKLIQAFQQCEMIKERFQKSKFLNLIENLMEELQKQLYEIEDNNKKLKSSNKSLSEKSQNYLENCNNFKEIQFQYHKLSNIKLRLENQQ